MELEQVIADRVEERVLSSLIGKAYETSDRKQVEDFAEWYVRVGELLGLEIRDQE